MTEDEARHWLQDCHGEHRFAKLEAYVALLLTASQTQNLISKSSEAQIWVRHILDSAQLVRFAPDARSWLDIGSGAGLPGLVLGIISDAPILLVEPRRKRAEFLAQAARTLSLDNVHIRQAEIDKVGSGPFGAVTARAFAPLPQLIASAVRLTELSTIWVLPKGRSAENELAEAHAEWHGSFHVEHSLTDDNARIIVATGVRPRCA